jgi:hypothetical protein
VLQVTILLAGISRAGVTMAGGLWRGLGHEDAARPWWQALSPGLRRPIQVISGHLGRSGTLPAGERPEAGERGGSQCGDEQRAPYRAAG